MRSTARVLRVLPLLVGLAACAGNPFSSRPGPDPREEDILDRDAIAHFTDARQAVETLRSGWLKIRVMMGPYTQSQVWVYQDGFKIGGIERLALMSTMEIEAIQYFDGIEASSRWGFGHENGVIAVTSRMR